MDNYRKNRASNSTPPSVCAIGASAGGVKALQDFFGAIDDNLGLSYVVVIHLAPDHPSQLSAILAGRTRMPVEQVEDSPKLRPNRVYVIAPDRELVIDGDSLSARPISAPRSKRATIDMFFRSVAAVRGDGFAVVLSGSGSDGALGIRAVKEAGGVIFVQDPNEAEYPTMPQSALATGVVDFVAPVSVLVQRIAEVVANKPPANEVGEQDAEHGLTSIIGLLHVRTGHDFSHYKRSTVMRRVARRMQVTRRDSLGRYIHYLRQEPQEAKDLLADLLVSVTSFFRDSGAFEILARKTVQPIFDKAGENGVRIWVVGCATGEEAYSIAMLLLEQASRSNVHVPIQIFASDLDERALAVAREGRYPKAIEQDVSEERLRRFFVEDGEHYRVRKEVRDLILFAVHSVLKDPPFIRIDLVSCRNLLIYLDRELQSQLCAVFHYALKSDGCLFLGSAENADSTPDLFRVVDREARIYAAKLVGERAVPVLPTYISEHHRAAAEHVPQRVDSATALANIHASALERRSPPSALVDSDYRLLHLSANAGRFIRPAEGSVTMEVWQLVRQELRLDLKFALQRAFEHGEATLTLPITMAIEGQERRIMAYVALTETAEGASPRALVMFLDASPGGTVAEREGADEVQAEEKRRLVQELTMAQERLSTSQRQYETAVQELRASNEELQSINEEYRSTSEELETSKEELQSINEELKTVNNELKNELENVSSAHSDLQNMIATAEIGTLFLDPQLRIKLFTPPLVKHFNVTKADLGRAITDFTHRLEYDGIENDAKNVLESLVPMEAEVKTRDGGWLMMRIRPYRTVDNVIDGVVLTFADVTEMKRAEESLAAELRAMTRLQQLSTRVLESAELEPSLLLVLDAAMELLSADFGQIQLCDDHTRKLRTVVQRGFDRSFLDHFAEVDGSEATAPGRAFSTRSQILIEDMAQGAGFQPDPEWARAGNFQAVHSTPLITSGGKPVGVLSTHFREPRQFSGHDLRLIDICARQASDAINAYLLQESVRKSETRMRQVLETESVGVLFIAEDGTLSDANNWFLQMTGHTRAEIDARELTWRKLTPPEWIALSEEQFDRLKVSGSMGPYEKELWCKDGSRRWMLLAGRALDDGTVAEYCIDISGRKRAEEERELLSRELSHRVKNTLAVVDALTTQTRGNSVKEFREKLSGRIRALAEATTLLLDSDWRAVDLEPLLRTALSAYHVEGAGRVQIEGVPLQVTPKQTQGLRLIVHELATNAVKHGAFSTPEGTLRLSWQVEETDDRQRQIRLRWEERGGPVVRPPVQTGFGIRLIRIACQFELEGEARLDHAPEGLTCEIVFPAT